MPVDCLLIALDAHMFSHNGYGPRTKDQGLKAAGSGALGPAAFGPWALVPGPYPLWLNICASRAINRQYMIGNTRQLLIKMPISKTFEQQM